MNRLLLCGVIASLVLTSCATSRPWNKQEKIAAGFFVLAHTADALTTDSMLERGYYEQNPILGKYPSDTKVTAYFSITALMALALTHYVPDLRMPLLVGYGTVNSGFAIHNSRLD